jgi:hypothetical protein
MTPPTNTIVRRIASWWSRLGKTQRFVYAALALALLASLLHVLFADNPWDSKIQRRLAEGRKLRVQDYVTIGLWWGFLVDTFLLAGLLGTAHWWLKTQPAATGSNVSGRSHAGAGFWTMAALSMAVLLMLGWSRMDHSLWGDEEHTLRQCVLGSYKPDKSGIYHLDRLKFYENLWTYVGPNNHFLFTLSSRLSLEIWDILTHDGGLHFNEAAARIPSLIAGLLALPAVGLLLRTAGFPSAAWVAMLFLAIHPWHLKYSTEARGYALVLLFAPLMLLSLLHALRTARWKWWITFAICEFCMLYAYPASLYLAVTANAAAFMSILLRHRERNLTIANGLRWVVSNICMAVVAIPLLAPCIPQMLAWLKRDRARGELPFEWIQDFAAYLTSGAAYHVWDSENPLCIAVSQWAPGVRWAFLGLFAVFTLAGFLAWNRQDKNVRMISWAMLLAAPLGFLHAKSSGNMLYVWYLIYALPALAAFAAAGLDLMSRRSVECIRSQKAGPFFGVILPAMFLIAYAMPTHAQRVLLRKHPLEPQRESVLLTRPSVDLWDPRNADILTGEFVFTTPLYDPLAVHLNTADDLRALMLRADQEQKPMFINFGSPGWARHAFPDIFELLDDPALFTKVGTLWGMDQQLTRCVYQYRGAIREEPADP